MSVSFRCWRVMHDYSEAEQRAPNHNGIWRLTGANSQKHCDITEKHIVTRSCWSQFLACISKVQVKCCSSTLVRIHVFVHALAFFTLFHSWHFIKNPPIMQKHNNALTEATWKELLVPRWSRSWHIQEIKRAKISISLKVQDREQRRITLVT